MPFSRSDGELIRGLQRQDPRLFRVLTQRYSRLLYWTILRIVPDRSEAQDILQDCLLKIWQNGHRLEASKEILLPWLLSVTRHTAIDHRRSKTHRQQQQTLPSSDDLPIACPASERVYGHLDQAYCWEVLKNHLEKTPLAVMQLVYFLDYTHQEAAQQLRLPLGTVKTHVRKALGQLRRLFNQGVATPPPIAR